MSNEFPAVNSPRLLLRPVEDEDAAPTAKLVSPDVASQLSTWQSPMTEEEALDRIRTSQKLLSQRKAVNFAIVRKADGTLLGWIGLWLVSDRLARIGYWIGTSYRRHGLTTEALSNVIPAAREFLGFSTIEALVLPNNQASRSLLGKLGFVEAGVEDEFIASQGRSRSCVRHLLDLGDASKTKRAAAQGHRPQG